MIAARTDRLLPSLKVSIVDAGELCVQQLDLFCRTLNRIDQAGKRPCLLAGPLFSCCFQIPEFLLFFHLAIKRGLLLLELFRMDPTNGRFPESVRILKARGGNAANQEGPSTKPAHDATPEV